ncbi:MAG: SLBB domain-containing protein [Treponema sp.]|jgi:protein involved in polysaccharide export with SLBB domain|nr:SLBB domain-containing protein [Treponema sp.]
MKRIIASVQLFFFFTHTVMFAQTANSSRQNTMDTSRQNIMDTSRQNTTDTSRQNTTDTARQNTMDTLIPSPTTVPNSSEADKLLKRIMLAMSNPDYRVTAGDVYTLTYMAAGMPVIYKIIVDSTYKIRVANLGIINAAGKTFPQLKIEVERIVSNNYPLSGVQLMLTEPALFTVYITGEVQTAQESQTWALERLSDVIKKEMLTDYASLRDVSVHPLNGQAKVYDLFKALRFGDIQQNPYVRPGDSIRVNRVKRIVTIEGDVERPGSYQLLPGENLKELVDYYAGGCTPLADTSRITLVRYVNSTVDSGDKIYLTLHDIQANYGLYHWDTVQIPTIVNLMPVMFVEGAVSQEDDKVEQASVSNRLTIRFNEGENYASLVQRNQNWFSSISDTKNAYIIRNGERIPINLNPMLYDSSYRSSYFVRENDTLIIPFRQYFVSVAGAVAVPGRYPYIPDRSWDYYVALAGGFNVDKNARSSIIIQDIRGKRLSKSDVITPESIITAKTNSFLHYFNQYAPIITTTLTLITTSLTLSTLLNR